MTTLFSFIKKLCSSTLLWSRTDAAFIVVALSILAVLANTAAAFEPKAKIHYAGRKRITYEAGNWLETPKWATTQLAFDMAPADQTSFEYYFTGLGQRYSKGTVHALDDLISGMQTIYDKAGLTKEEFQQIFPLFFYHTSIEENSKIQCASRLEPVDADDFLALAFEKTYQTLNLLPVPTIIVNKDDLEKKITTFEFFEESGSPSAQIVLSSDNKKIWDNLLGRRTHYRTYVELDPALPLFPKAVAIFRIKSKRYAKEDKFNPTVEQLETYMKEQKSLVNPVAVQVDGTPKKNIYDMVSTYVVRSDLQNLVQAQ